MIIRLSVLRQQVNCTKIIQKYVTTTQSDIKIHKDKLGTDKKQRQRTQSNHRSNYVNDSWQLFSIKAKIVDKLGNKLVHKR